MVMDKIKQRKGLGTQLSVFIILLLSLVIFLYLFLNGILIEKSYVSMSILSLCYFTGIIILYLLNPSFTKNLPILIIIISYGIRMVLFPLFSLETGIYINKVNIGVYKNLNYAVLLQCYELLCIVFVMGLYGREKILFQDINIMNDIKHIRNIKRSTIFISIVLLLIVLIYPSLLLKFRPLFFLNDNDYIQWKINSNQAKNEISSVLYYLSTWAIKLLRYILAYFIVIMIKKKSNKNKATLSIFLSLLIILFMLILIATDDKAGSLYISIALLLLLAKLYPLKQKLLLRKIPVIFGVFMVFIFLVEPLLRNNSTDVLHYISARLNAYFSGTVNISAALSMPRNNILNFFVADTLRSVPLVKGFFTEMPTSTILFNLTLGIDPIYNSQILPCIGQGAYYLSFIGAPIFSMILVYSAIKSYRKAQNAVDSFGFFIYCSASIFLSVGPILYNLSLTFALIMEYILPLLLLYKLFRKKKLIENSSNNTTIPV